MMEVYRRVELVDSMSLLALCSYRMMCWEEVLVTTSVSMGTLMYLKSRRDDTLHPGPAWIGWLSVLNTFSCWVAG